MIESPAQDGKNNGTAGANGSPQRQKLIRTTGLQCACRAAAPLQRLKNGLGALNKKGKNVVNSLICPQARFEFQALTVQAGSSGALM